MSSPLALSLSALSSGKGEHSSYRKFLSFVAALEVKVLDVADLGPRSRIGEGGEAVVYKSHLIRNPESVVCVKETKQILTHGIAEVEHRRVSAVLASLLQELCISAHQVLKDHPNIPHIVGVAFQQESLEAMRPLVVVELACGTLTYQFPRSPIDERLRLSRDVADGLVALQSYGIVHGDVKSDNALVFVRATGLVAAISDFGGSRSEGSTDDIPATPQFFAPEVHNRSALYFAHANRKPRDVYSFGLLLCQGLLGESVFCGITSDEQFVLQDKDGARSYVAEKLAKLSVPLDMILQDIIDSCLARQPGERPSMLAVSRRLSAVLGEVRSEIPFPSEVPLLDEAADPRTRFMNQIYVKSSLAAKLFLEYSSAVIDTEDTQVILYLIAFYQGAFGPQFALKTPLNHIATAQWLLKAIELDSQMIMHHDPVLLVVAKQMRSHILSSRALSYQPPDFNLPKLFSRLGVLAEIHEEAKQLLGYLQLQKKEKKMLKTGVKPTSETLPPVYHQLGVIHRFSAPLQLHGDLNMDVFTRLLRDAHPIMSAICNDDRATVSTLVSMQTVSQDDWTGYLEVAIIGDSPKIVQHIVDEALVDIGRTWQSGQRSVGDKKSFRATVVRFFGAPFFKANHPQAERTWLDLAVMCGRVEVTSILLKWGLQVTFHHGHSALCLVTNPAIAELLCSNLAKDGRLAEALGWRLESPLRPKSLTPFEFAVTQARWSVAAVFLRHGAAAIDLKSFPVILKAVSPFASMLSLSFLGSLVEAGACLDVVDYGLTALLCAVATLNVSATFFLLIAGADTNVTVKHRWSTISAMQVAKDNVAQRPLRAAVDLNGNIVTDGPKQYLEACQLIHKALEIASCQENGWKERLQKDLGEAPKDVLYKAWALRKKDVMLQFVIPDH